MDWDFQILNQFIYPPRVKAIKKTPLSSIIEEDEIFWYPISKYQFSVKFAYDWSTTLPIPTNEGPRILSHMWKHIWHPPILLKLNILYGKPTQIPSR